MLTVMRRLEEEGRERASRLDELPRNDASFLSRMAEVAGRSKYEEFGQAIARAATALSIPAEFCMHDGITRRECWVPGYVVQELKAVDAIAKKVIGNRCTWLLDRVRGREYNLAMAMNDLTACFHRLIELEEAPSRKQITSRVEVIE